MVVPFLARRCCRLLILLSLATALQAQTPDETPAIEPAAPTESIPHAGAAPASPEDPVADVTVEPGDAPALTELRAGETVVFVVPVQGQISQPSLFVLRRGLKEAITRGATFVVLDMQTPGGRADVMLEMMEALERFDGLTATFVNDEAGSAGALIAAVTDEIYFAPTGVMGAAEIITGTGADVPDALKRKMTSYINAKVRALSRSDNPRRGDVLKAMTSPEFELKIGDEVIKPAGELLTLTAQEAVRMYGDPPLPLLADGIAASVDELLAQRFPGQELTVVRLETTWSENVAQWLTAFSPILLGLGLLGLFIEFKTPGFGVFGVVGGLLMLVVFFGHYVAGLSGHEPALVFGIGIVLVAVELLLLPGTVIVGLLGVILMLGSVVWSMADLWPNEPISFTGEVFARPLANLVLGLAVATGGAVAIVRFLPRGWFWDRLVLSSAVGVPVTGAPVPAATAPASASLVGQRGVAVTALYPSGQVEIEGKRYEARLLVGFAEAGTPVIVQAQREFALIVEPAGVAS
jgi:membrane-bound serine protease (ClpP class)